VRGDGAGGKQHRAGVGTWVIRMESKTQRLETGRLRRLVVMPLLFLVFGGAASAGTVGRVVATVACDSGGNLQAAIDAAAPGATIMVSGTCRGHFGVQGKDLKIQGSPSATLDGSGSFGSTVFAGAGSGDPYHTLTLENVTVTGGTDAGIIAYHWNLTLVASTVSGNDGSGIRARDFFSPGGLVRLIGSTVSGNTKTGSGGGIDLGDSASASLTDSTVSGNKTTGNGGGIDSESGTITLHGTTVSGNSASSGGGISGEVVMTNSTVTGNTAIAGGGVAADGTFTNSAISGNTAEEGAGCVCTGTLADMTISGNTATFGAGGGLYVGRFGAATLTRTSISGNTAEDGGGIFSDEGYVTIADSMISSNDVAARGGSGAAIWEYRGGWMTITGSTIDGNTSIDAGGAIRNDLGMLEIDDSVLSGNSAGGVGTHDPNFAEQGGAIWNNGTTTLNDTTVTQNHAGQRGGGIYDVYGSTLVLNGSTLSSNAAVLGGGLFNAGSATLTNSTITSNTARDAGGGIYNGSDTTSYGASLTLDGTTVSDNVAGGTTTQSYGGGLFDTGRPGVAAVANVTNSRFTANHAVSGGGIWVSGTGQTATVDLTGTRIDHNTAGGGGGIAMDGAGGLPAQTAVTLDTGTSVDHNSSANGGGVLDIHQGLLTLAGGTVTQNVPNDIVKY
jgi:hypothetical protein